GLCITYLTLLSATREVEIGLMFAGQIGCEALNFALKRAIREERPRGECLRNPSEPATAAADPRKEHRKERKRNQQLPDAPP
ncbi:MAG: hypothetical protein LQ340_008137, partial [Diploschistes diacapsis]